MGYNCDVNKYSAKIVFSYFVSCSQKIFEKKLHQIHRQSLVFFFMLHIFRYKHNVHETVFFHAAHITAYSTTRMKLKSILGVVNKCIIFIYNPSTYTICIILYYIVYHMR